MNTAPCPFEHDVTNERRTRVDTSRIDLETSLTSHIHDGQVVTSQELDTAHPLIHKLPGEILSSVFQFICPPVIFGQPPDVDRTREQCPPLVHMILSHVCRFWRETMVSTPQLWTRLTLFIEPHNFEAAISLLLRSLDRSGDLPLYFMFTFSHTLTFPSGTLVDKDVDALLVRNFPRIRQLRLQHPPSAWLSPLLPPLKHLTCFSLGFVHTEEPHDFHRFPRLNHLHLMRVWPSNILGCSSTITILKLETIPIEACVTILPQCPNLVEFQNKCPHRALDPDGPFQQMERLSFQKMKVFAWEVLSGGGIDMAWQSIVLNNIHLPALQVLRWGHQLHNRVRYPAYGLATDNFFLHLPVTLTTLELNNIVQTTGPMPDHYSQLVANIPSDVGIEHIIFNKCNPMFIQAVIPGFLSSRFPKLRRITLQEILFSAPLPGFGHSAGEDSEYISLTIMGMLEGRRTAFSLHLIASPEFVWVPYIQRGFNTLSSRGSELEILQDSKPVSWLA